MKIRVAIFDQDQEYQSRLAETLQKNYPEKLEVFTCSSVESIPDTVSQNDVQLLAVSQGTELDVTQLQDKCAVVSLVETKVNKEITADNIFDVPEVGRYQSINDIARALYVYGNSYKDIFEPRFINLDKSSFNLLINYRNNTYVIDFEKIFSSMNFLK